MLGDKDFLKTHLKVKVCHDVNKKYGTNPAKETKWLYSLSQVCKRFLPDTDLSSLVLFPFQINITIAQTYITPSDIIFDYVR